MSSLKPPDVEARWQLFDSDEDLHRNCDADGKDDDAFYDSRMKCSVTNLKSPLKGPNQL